MENNKSWFTQFWPWFLIILPMTAVIAGITTVIIATKNKPEMVVDDYYRKGKAINADLSLLKNAKKLNISATLTFQNDELLIHINGMKNKGSIQLSLYHPTLAHRDITLMLTADGNGLYRFQSDKNIDGKWQLRIEPFDKSWRLQKTVMLPSAHISL